MYIKWDGSRFLYLSRALFRTNPWCSAVRAERSTTKAELQPAEGQAEGFHSLPSSGDWTLAKHLVSYDCVANVHMPQLRNEVSEFDTYLGTRTAHMYPIQRVQETVGRREGEMKWTGRVESTIPSGRHSIVSWCW